MNFKNKTKAYEKQSRIYGSYTRVTSNDVNSRYYYQSNFASGYYGIWSCGTEWYVGGESDKGKCIGAANSNSNTEKCVHDIGFDWKYFDSPNLSDAGEGLAVKCLYEHGNC